MEPRLFKCKITVLKVTINQDLVDEYLNVDEHYGPCSRFREGQTFIIDQPYELPAGFCAWAWADIRNTILSIATGATKPWSKQPGVEVVGCTDWYRPVYFKVERIVEA